MRLTRKTASPGLRRGTSRVLPKSTRSLAASFPQILRARRPATGAGAFRGCQLRQLKSDFANAGGCRGGGMIRNKAWPRAAAQLPVSSSSTTSSPSGRNIAPRRPLTRYKNSFRMGASQFLAGCFRAIRIGAEKSLPPCPLTPALSLGERGQVSPRRQCWGVPVGRRREAFLPLPEGEGRGEGEGTLRVAEPASTRLSAACKKVRCTPPAKTLQWRLARMHAKTHGIHPPSNMPSYALFSEELWNSGSFLRIRSSTLLGSTAQPARRRKQFHAA
jgi:hypothetical protein